jgi:phosphoglycolate phosphatase-like HAD superfamily hydrolase
MKVFHAIVFDFDYTLADSSAGAVECINFALGRMGLPAVPAERVQGGKTKIKRYADRGLSNGPEWVYCGL